MIATIPNTIRTMITPLAMEPRFILCDGAGSAFNDLRMLGKWVFLAWKVRWLLHYGSGEPAIIQERIAAQHRVIRALCFKGIDVVPAGEYAIFPPARPACAGQ